MSLSDRLRAEARAIPAPDRPGLVPRIQAAVRRDPRPVVAPEAPRIIPFRVAFAAAAGLAAALGAVWFLLPQPAPAPAPVAVVAPSPAPVPAPLAVVPVPPALDTILAAMPQNGPLSGELAALGHDLDAAAQAVRGAVPF